MYQIDERILETLAERGGCSSDHLHSTLNELSRDLNFRPGQIDARCRLLDQYGLIDYTGTQKCFLTDLGESFLAGEQDAAELSAPSDHSDGSNLERVE